MQMLEQTITGGELADVVDAMFAPVEKAPRHTVMAAALFIATCLMNPTMSPDQVVSVVRELNEYLALKSMPPDMKGN